MLPNLTLIASADTNDSLFMRLLFTRRDSLHSACLKKKKEGHMALLLTRYERPNIYFLFVAVFAASFTSPTAWRRLPFT